MVLRSSLEQFLIEQKGILLEPPEDSMEEAGRNADEIERVPARDGIPANRTVRRDQKGKPELPLFTLFVIIINALVFFGQSSGAFDDEMFMVTNDILSLPGQWYRLFTYSLLHVSFSHLVSNMVALYAAGEIVEKKLGKKFFLAIYTLSGLAAGIRISIYLR